MTTGLPVIPDRIQWHEGMLLAPQHFQQLQARVDGLAAWHLLAAAPLAWGVARCDIDPNLLATGLLRVLKLEAVLADGSAVWHDAADALDAPLELDLAGLHGDALDAGAVDVWLTLPAARSMRNPSAPARFRGVNAPPADDEVSDAEPADLPRLRPRLGLAAGAVPPALWQHLRLCTVVRDNGQLRITDELPPLLRLGADHPLRQRAWAVCRELRAKAAWLARQGQLPSSRLEDRLAMLEDRARLSALLAPLTALEAVLQTEPLHPHALWLALCAALGPLATLRPGAMPVMPPAWRHDAPREGFDLVLAALQDALAEVSQDYRLLPFGLAGGVFARAVEGGWLGKRLVVGLRGQPERDLAAWMESAVIGADSAWNSLRERRVLGAARARIEAAPELGLRGGGGYTLFEIDPAGAGLATGGTLRIANANEAGDARRPHEIVLFVKGAA
ncbi:type VI secretion system baseplate subunit TssK [Derxia gummosa]|uniref:Type VI secretion system baseplate subunit TssK n=1 Tax=Derxia gummosa DSM 723 TaxID=1121388 RepID=A0A8B6X414_9BURK|nr:type VI secretion system baseplate subunit TssK [Derxia gummosa]